MILPVKSLFSTVINEKQPLAASLLTRAIATGRLANAYLLTGSNREDKQEMALELACILNCLNTTGDTASSCPARFGAESASYCQNCRLIRFQKHPQAYLELLSLDPDNPNSKIPVEKARELAFELTKTSPFFRVIWLSDARQEIFHRPAANSLLKTIEEPKNRCLFLLPARSKELVLPTIVSRSQEIPFVQNQASLLLAGGADNNNDEEMSQWSRLPFFQWRNSARATSITRQEALEVSRLVYGIISKQTQETAFEEDPLDRLVLLELSIIGSSSISNPYLSRYFMNLTALVQSLRTRLGRHVSQKASLDNFFIEWLNLRTQVSGNCR